LKDVIVDGTVLDRVEVLVPAHLGRSGVNEFEVDRHDISGGPRVRGCERMQARKLDRAQSVDRVSARRGPARAADHSNRDQSGQGCSGEYETPCF
jgi:hypothetical protein